MTQEEEKEAMELKPCRWCNDTNSAVTWEAGFCGVQCQTCGATGPQKSNETDAIAAWNRRAPSARGEIDPIMAALNAAKHEIRSHQWQKVPANDWATGRQDGLEKAIEVIDDALIARANAASAPGEGGKWLSIDSAPKDGTCLLLCRNADADGLAIEPLGIFCQCAAWWGDESNGRWIVYADEVQDPALFFVPTHWQHLPAPPIANTHDQ